MEEFLAYMKIDVEQRMMDHMLETSNLLNDKDSIIFISSDSEAEETGSVIDRTESQKEERPVQKIGNQGQNDDNCKSSMIEVKIRQQNNYVLKNTNGTQSTSDTDKFCSKFNSAFDKNPETDTGLNSGVTESCESGEEKTVMTSTQSETIDEDPTSSPSRSPSLDIDFASIPQTTVKDSTRAVNKMPVNNSTSENRVPKASKGDLSLIRNESMPDSNSGSPDDSSSDASSNNCLTDLRDEAYIHTEERGPNNNVSVFGKRKRPSGRNDAMIAETPEENIEIMKRTLRCFQCHRVFLSKNDVEDEDHFCAFFGNLRKPLTIDSSPTPSKKVSLKCVMCPSPVFSDTTELMKHIILGHETDWLMRDAENHIHLLTDSDYALRECWNCDCDNFAESEEDYFIHQGIHHERLFWALKHHRHHNFKNLCKRLFPGKMKDNPLLLWSEDSMDEEREVRKRGLDQECENTDEGTGSSTKRILLLADKSREEEERSEDNSQENQGIDQDENSDIFFPQEYLNGNMDADEDPKDNRNEETDKRGQMDSSDTDSEPYRKAKKSAKIRIQSSSTENASYSNVSDFDYDNAVTENRIKKKKPSQKVVRNSLSIPMERKECPICSEKLSNSGALKRHLVIEHFKVKMLEEYPHCGVMHGRYPCGVGDCKEVSLSWTKRLIHIGVKHKVFEEYLTQDNFRVEMRERETPVEREYCDHCHNWFSRRERISHDCVQAFLPIIHDDIVLLGSEDDTNDDRIMYSSNGDLNRIMKDPEDMRKAILELCSDDDDNDDERSGVLPVSEDQEMFECEAVRCHMEFSSRRLRDEHQKMEHKAWEDF